MRTAFVFFCAFSPLFIVGYFSYQHWRTLQLQKRLNKLRLLKLSKDMELAKARMKIMIAEQLKKQNERSFPE